jgi:hypothetical protein
MKLNDLEIGNLVRFKNEEPPINVEYYGIVIDKSVISGHFWVQWFNHALLDFEVQERYDLNLISGKYSKFWSIIS